MTTPSTHLVEQLAAENRELRRQLAEAHEALDAIRHGEVDAVVVDCPGGPQVYTLTGADQPYRIMVEEMQEGAVTLRADAAVMYCNKQIARMLGTVPQGLLGVSLRDFVAPESRAVFEDLWQRSRSRPGRGEVTLQAADGTQVAALLTLNLLPSEEPAQTSVVITDLTEHKRHQEMVAAEAFARQRAVELAAADRRKDEFLALLAHELRNPLAPLCNGIDVLRMLPPDGDRGQSVLDMMAEQARNMVRLVDDLLDVSRCTQGKLELRRQPLSLSTIVTSAVQTAQPLIQANGHELTVTQAPENLQLYGDATRLTQVISNLLSNAARYTHRGGKILLTTERSGDTVAVRVRDNGIGIDPEMQSRVFDLFVQANNSLNRSQGGLGIGLTLVKSLVEMHGGRVEVASPGLGQGSLFTVRLPLLPAGDVGGEAAPEATAPSPVFPAHRILVVDDVRPAALLVAKLLRFWNQNVRTATSGAEALAMMAQQTPDMVLSDISMPGMSGHELAQEIRRRPAWNGVYLVAVTGYGQDSDKKLAREAGFNDHVVKPISSADLERLLVSLAYQR